MGSQCQLHFLDEAESATYFSDNMQDFSLTGCKQLALRSLSAGAIIHTQNTHYKTLDNNAFSLVRTETLKEKCAMIVFLQNIFYQFTSYYSSDKRSIIISSPSPSNKRNPPSVFNHSSANTTALRFINISKGEENEVRYQWIWVLWKCCLNAMPF